MKHSQPDSRRSLALAGLALAMMTLALPAVAQVQPMSAVGDANNLWIVRTSDDGKSFTLLHRRPIDLPETRLTPLPEPIHGRIAPKGLAAGEDYLLIVYEDRTVQTLRAMDDTAGRRGFTDLILPSLPAGAALRSLAITPSGPWALVRIEDPAVLEAIDHPAEQRSIFQKRKPAMKDLEKAPPSTPVPTPAPTPVPTPAPEPSPPPATLEAGKDDKKAEPEAQPAITAPPADAKPKVKADRLLYLKQDRWVSAAMPTDWPEDAEGWIVHTLSTDARPMLVVMTATPRAIRSYRWAPPHDADAGLWTRQEHAIEQVVNLPPTAASQQLIIARRKNTPGKLEVALSGVRLEGVAEIGTLSLPEPTQGWSLTTQGDRVALIAQAGEELVMQRMDVKGRVIDPEPISLKSQPPPLGPVADLFVFVAVLMLATPMLILMLRRDPSAPIVQLPGTLRLGDLPLRAVAAVIDLVPCVGAVVFFWDVSVVDLVDAWPGNSGGWERMIPGLVVIGSFVVYSFVAEVFFAKTIGKAIMGLRVTGLKGEPPDLWQVLSRNGLKALDMIAPPLIIFAIISPSRQRLGDVVARTVIVTRVNLDGDDDELNKGKRSDETKPLDPRSDKPRNPPK
ncbi:MAG: RDD family protein [Phycisphaeraceae bacterium]